MQTTPLDPDREYTDRPPSFFSGGALRDRFRSSGNEQTAPAPPPLPLPDRPRPTPAAAIHTRAWGEWPDRQAPPSVTADAVSVLMYLVDGRVHGWLSSPRGRVSDSLNVDDQRHVLVQHAQLMALSADGSGPDIEGGGLPVLAEMLLRQQAVVMIAPRDALPGAERAWGSDREWVAKDLVPVVIDAGPYRVYGWAHLQPGGRLVDLLYTRRQGFVPITDGWVQRRVPAVSGAHSDAPDDSPSFGVVLVNRDHIQLLAEIPAPSFDDPARPSGVMQVDPRQFTMLLGQSTVFRAEDPANMRRMVGSLVAQGLVELRIFKPGQTIIRQGDIGNTMYVVVYGNVTVERWHPRLGMREIARLGAGDVFGEAAVVREGRRNASVRAVGDTRVAAIHREGVHWLTAESPAIAEGIVGLLTNRETSRS